MNGKAAGSSRRHALRLSRDELIVATLGQLAADDGLLQRFVTDTGQSPAELRDALATESAQAGLLDFLVGNDDLIVAVAQALGRSPEDVAAAALGATRRDVRADYF